MTIAAEIIFALLQDMSQVQVEQFVTILWSLWKSRNMRVWQNATETCQSWMREAVVDWLEQQTVANNRVGWLEMELVHISENMLADREGTI